MKNIKLSICNVFATSNTIFFDVDDTLILWETLNRHDQPDEVISNKTVESPNKKLQGFVTVEDPYMAGHIMKFKPHVAHCHILMRNFKQGRTVIVWSAAGYMWAQTIVKALALEPYVSLIMDKPSLYVDDTPMENWKPKRIFLEDDNEG